MWDGPGRWAVHKDDEVVLQSPPTRAAGWFWVLTAPVLGLYAVSSIDDTLGGRVSAAVIAALIWCAIGWPYLRARVTLTPNGLRVRRSMKTRLVPWQEFAGLRWRHVFVSRLATKGLQVELQNGHHLLVRLLAVSAPRWKIVAEHIQHELERYRELHNA